MSSAREDVLRRIREANAAAGGLPPPPVPRDYRRTGTRPPGSPALVELLTDRLVDYRATVLDARTTGVPAAISSALDGMGGPVVIPAGLPASWCPQGVPDHDGLGPAELNSFAAVVTASVAACAETGTIALDHTADQGRRAITLVPDVHVCVVATDLIVETVPELLAALDPLRPITLISGPSATSDIELERVEGVHGPRTLVVVVTDGDRHPPTVGDLA